jgi:hypothetical protein
VYWKTLQLRGFINGEDHTLTPWGVGLTLGLEKLTEHRDLCDSLVLAVELFRLKLLHGEDFSVKYPDAAMHVTGISPFSSKLILDEEKKHIRYICRVACTVTMTAPPETWQGPISRSYLAMLGMVSEFQRNMRALVENVCMAMMVHYDVVRVNREGYEFTQIGLKYITPTSFSSNRLMTVIDSRSARN